MSVFMVQSIPDRVGTHNPEAEGSNTSPATQEAPLGVPLLVDTAVGVEARKSASEDTTLL